MIISVVGMPRSASTALYNLIKWLYKDKTDFYSSLWNDRDNNSHEIQLFKCHEYDYDLHKSSNVIISTIRDFREVMASFKRYRNNEIRDIKGFIHWSDLFMEWYKGWEPHSSVEVRYESLMDNDEIELKKLLNILKIKYDIKEIYSVFKSFRNIALKDVSDISDSLFFPNHITSISGGYIGTLTKEEISYIENKYRDWLVEKKYL